MRPWLDSLLNWSNLNKLNDIRKNKIKLQEVLDNEIHQNLAKTISLMNSFGAAIQKQEKENDIISAIV